MEETDRKSSTRTKIQNLDKSMSQILYKRKSENTLNFDTKRNKTLKSDDNYVNLYKWKESKQGKRRMSQKTTSNHNTGIIKGRQVRKSEDSIKSEKGPNFNNLFYTTLELQNENLVGIDYGDIQQAANSGQIQDNSQDFEQ